MCQLLVPSFFNHVGVPYVLFNQQGQLLTAQSPSVGWLMAALTIGKSMDGEAMVLTNVKGLRLGFSDWPTISRIDGIVMYSAYVFGVDSKDTFKAFPIQMKAIPH